MQFLRLLELRNQPLFIFGYCNVVGAVIFLGLAQITNRKIRGANAWFKPFKFALSIGIFSWTMGWFSYHLHAPIAVNLYDWATILLLGFEIIYISLQAGRGKLSHYNTSSAVYSFLTALMGIAAAMATLWTGYIGILFCMSSFPDLPDYYVLSIRIGIFLFVFFAFQGAAMGARQSHTVGGPEGEEVVPVLNWSRKYGDLRIAHFIGMHALQLLPLLSWYVLKTTTGTLIAGLLYALLALYMLLSALKGKPFVSY
ncbi:hypothetical protein [Mucilaginibacter paludis]|uniref:Uncharacterized protein n=1 Tax=Mucilaginibacter paludis DSM 18603 TaxID=714943 RepID=H1YC74_9SPHI|nr:hypothetical protein [Mucilaginibacter paludis]EHQ29637.1 hypothetical protein Mucpa_5566 [Mucilaginibacter paludis DSM 18603]